MNNRPSSGGEQYPVSEEPFVHDLRKESGEVSSETSSERSLPVVEQEQATLGQESAEKISRTVSLPQQPAASSTEPVADQDSVQTYTVQMPTTLNEALVSDNLAALEFLISPEGK